MVAAGDPSAARFIVTVEELRTILMAASPGGDGAAGAYGGSGSLAERIRGVVLVGGGLDAFTALTELLDNGVGAGEGLVRGGGRTRASSTAFY